MTYKKIERKKYILCPIAKKNPWIADTNNPVLEFKINRTAAKIPIYACAKTYMGAISFKLGIYFEVQFFLSMPSYSIIYSLYPG
jgi:hypothetical protein